MKFAVEFGAESSEEVGMRKNETMICAPIMADTVDQMVELMHEAKLKGADIVEIRLDHLKSFDPNVDIKKLMKECHLPTLVTNLLTDLFGKVDNTMVTKIVVSKLLSWPWSWELIILTLSSSFMNGNKPENCKVIVSSHNYDCTPSDEDLGSLVARIQAAGADIVKFATTALDITDVARVFQITVHSQVPIIAMVMGERGVILRLLWNKERCPLLGSRQSRS